MSDAELRLRLRVDAVDQFELESVVLSHFGNASSPHHQEIVYRHGADSAPALVFRYDAAGTLAAIEPGPTLQPSDIAAIEAKIEADILAPAPERIARRVLFAGVPVTGWFRHKDSFQLLPVPPEAPRPQFLSAAHPLLLEVRVRTSSNFQLAHYRQRQSEEAIELLCVALIPLINGSLGDSSAHHWVLVDQQQPWISHYCQEMYAWPDMQFGEGFSPTAGLPEMTRVKDDQYFARRGVTVDQVLDVAEGLDRLLTTFFGCSHDDRERFLRATYWFRHAQRDYRYSQSAAFLGLASALEALMPAASAGIPCKECHRPIGKSIRKQFVEFVEEFAPGPAVSSEQKTKLYGLRSAMAHGGRLLHSDRYGHFGAFNSHSVKQWEDMTTMWSAVRVVLVNWLASRAASQAVDSRGH